MYLLQIFDVFPLLGNEGLVASQPRMSNISLTAAALSDVMMVEAGRALPWCRGDTRSCWRLLSWRSLWRSDTVTVYRPAAIKLRVSPHLGQFIFVIHHVHIQGKTRHIVSSTTHLIITLPPPPPLCLSVSSVRVSLTRSDSQSAQPRQ